MASGDLLELGHLVGALLVCIGAAGAETAAGRRVQRAGHIAMQHDTLGLAGRNGVCHRNCGNQAAGVGVDAVGDQLVAVGQLHHLAQIHHADAVGDVLDNAQVMGDEQVGQMCIRDRLTTEPGIAINEKGQALDTNNQPMEGLYITGDMSGSFFANNYPCLMAGVAMGRTLTFAMKAVKQMAGLENA